MHKLISLKFILVLLLILIGGFLRFYKLSSYPIQLNHDEISQLYDTASIVQTGKDIYGNFLPLAFPSTGDFKVGHYIYISTIPYLIFGDKEITIRIAAAFFGTLTPLAVLLFIFALTRNFTISLFSAGMVAITPSEIFYSRKSFEGEIGVFLIFLGLFCLLKGSLYRYVGLILLAAAMYVYTSYTMVVPLIILLFAITFRKKVMLNPKKFLLRKQQTCLYPLLFFIILIIPIVYVSFVSEGLRFRASSVLISQDQNLTRQLEISQNSTLTFLDYVFNKYLTQFNPSYLFGNGLDFTNQGLIGMGPLLFWQLPLFVLGIIFMIKRLSFRKIAILLGLIAIPMIPAGLTFEPFSPHRVMPSFVVISIISGLGLYFLRVRILLFSLILTLLLINLVYFIHMYTINYPYEKSQSLHYPFKEVALFVWSQHDNFDKIIIDPTYGQSAPVYGVATHYYLAYYGKYQPAKFQKDLKVNQEGLSFDKFSIRKIDWSKDQSLKNTLIIASPWQIPIKNIENEKIVKTFSFYDGQDAFYAVAL